MKVEEAAKKLGMSNDSLMEALKHDLFKPQIGIAVMCGRTYRYHVFEERLNKYLKGEI